MRLRRCAVLYLEPREDVHFDLDSLLTGGAGLKHSTRWLAIAPHLPAEIEVDPAEREALGQLSPSRWTCRTALTLHDSALGRLIDEGLVVGDGNGQQLQRDAALRATHWWPPAALAHAQSRWAGIDGVTSMQEHDLLTAEGLCKRLGPPPPHVGERVPANERVSLSRRNEGDFDSLLARRTTCRNFAPTSIPEGVFGRMLQRVFSSQAEVQAYGESRFLKKTSPSGGGLHATEAYLIVQNVEGVAPGLYHYHPVDHALEPLSDPDVPLADFAKLALAGQHWFSNAPVLVVLAPRFARSFWKYRYHAKAYRALILDSGHLSQTLYLSATDLGLGAFVTSAINEVDIEQAFGMDPLEESPLAICGFGWRAERMETAEFDPAGEVWEPAESPSGDPSL